MLKKAPPFRLCLFPGYRWCGPGCSGPGAPVNEVDACCMRHDLCLQKGYHSCYCDRQFMKCLDHYRTPMTPSGRHANLMYQFMKVKTSLTCGPNR